MGNKSTKFWIVFVICLIAGLLLGWIDSRPNWDDTGITAGMIFITTLLSGLVIPKRAWLWAVLVSIWIPLAGILLTKNYSSALALLFGFAGAYCGVLFNKLFINH